jgi:hypothetical protein
MNFKRYHKPTIEYLPTARGVMNTVPHIRRGVIITSLYVVPNVTLPFCRKGFFIFGLM